MVCGRDTQLRGKGNLQSVLPENGNKSIQLYYDDADSRAGVTTTPIDTEGTLEITRSLQGDAVPISQ